MTEVKLAWSLTRWVSRVLNTLESRSETLSFDTLSSPSLIASIMTESMALMKDSLSVQKCFDLSRKSSPTLYPSPLTTALNTDLMLSRSCGERLLTMPGSKITNWLGAAYWSSLFRTRMLPGCKSACTRLSVNIIFKHMRTPILAIRWLSAIPFFVIVFLFLSMNSLMCLPLSYDSTITSRWQRSKNGLGNTMSGCFEKLALNLLRFLASTLRSSCDFMSTANSSRPSFMLSQFRSGNIHVARSANVRISRRSRRNLFSTLGWSTLTATSTPSYWASVAL